MQATYVMNSYCDNNRIAYPRKFLVVGVIFLFLLLVIGVSGLAIFKAGASVIDQQEAEVHTVVDVFMKNMVARNVDGSYNMFSIRSQRQTPQGKVQQMTEGVNYTLFDGYEKVVIQNLAIDDAASTNPDLPQGKVATLDGIVQYQGGFTGGIRAVLEKEGEAWRIYAVNITVPPAKIERFASTQSQ